MATESVLTAESVRTDHIVQDILRAHRPLIIARLHAHGFDESTTKVYRNRGIDGAIVRVIFGIVRMAERYGITGYGDKPPEMDAVEYWLAHQDYDKLAEMKFTP